MTRTALQVITDSLKLIGVVAGHEVPTPDEQTDSFARLQELIDAWGTHAHTMWLSARQPVPLSAGVQTYAIGPGATVDAPRPMAVDAVSVLTGTGAAATEVFLDRGTDQAWVAVAQKMATGSPPTTVVYNPTVPDGEIWVSPIPTAPQTLVVYYRLPVQQFPDLTTPVALAPGYAKALRTNLALELAPEFGRVVDPVVERSARESLADIKRQNVALVELSTPLGCGGSYDILTDT